MLVSIQSLSSTFTKDLRFSQSETTIYWKNLTMHVFISHQKDCSLSHIFFSSRSSGWNGHCWKFLLERGFVRSIVFDIVVRHSTWEDSRSDCVDSYASSSRRSSLISHGSCQMVDSCFGGVVSWDKSEEESRKKVRLVENAFRESLSNFFNFLYNDSMYFDPSRLTIVQLTLFNYSTNGTSSNEATSITLTLLLRLFRTLI